MDSDVSNPLLEYVFEQTNHFKTECLRLKDPTPLEQYKAMVDTLFFIGQRLGTVEHEVAMSRLDNEFAQAQGEAGAAWKEIWYRFRRGRKEAIETELQLSSHDRETRKLLAELERDYEATAGKHPELDTHLRAALDAAHQAGKTGLALNRGWRRGPWLFLWADLQIYSVYVRFFFAKLAFFVFRHSLIMLGAILILGLLYSQTFKLAADFFGQLASNEKWIGAAVVLGGYIFKKYYLDSKFKKLQVRLESKRLRPLAFNVHVLRAIAAKIICQESTIPSVYLTIGPHGREVLWPKGVRSRSIWCRSSTCSRPTSLRLCVGPSSGGCGTRNASANGHCTPW